MIYICLRVGAEQLELVHGAGRRRLCSMSVFRYGQFVPPYTSISWDSEHMATDIVVANCTHVSEIEKKNRNVQFYCKCATDRN